MPGIAASAIGPLSCCPAPYFCRKSKCFLLILFLCLVSFATVTILYNWECSPLIKDCSHHIISQNANSKKETFTSPNVSERGLEENKNVQKSKSSKASYSGNEDDLTHQLIQLRQRTGQMNNLINYTSIQQDEVQFKIDQNDVMVFLHIQKTGGTTFERHLVRDIDLEAPCTCRKKKRRKKLYLDDDGRPKKWFAGGCECFRPNTKSDVAQTKSTWLFSRYNTGWKCGLHADWTELTECVDSYLDTEEGVTNRR